MKRCSKKSQMGIFLVVGLIMFILVFVIFSAVSISKKAALRKRADAVASALVDKTALSNYVDSCLAQVSKDTFKELSLSGGYFYNLTDNETGKRLNKDVKFIPMHDSVNNETDYLAYLVLRGSDDIAPFYPCPLMGGECGGPGDLVGGAGDLYCGYAFEDFPYYDTCTYGDRDLISLVLTKNSIERQLELKISSELAKCVNLEYFTEELGYEFDKVEQGNIVTDVSFGDDSIVFKSDYPIVVSLSDVDSVKISSSSFTMNLDFKKMFNNLFFGSKSVLLKEMNDLDNSITEYLNSQIAMNDLRYEVIKEENAYFMDDIYTIRHKDFMIGDAFYEFKFAVQNRLPVLSLIDYAPDNPQCEIVTRPNMNFELKPEYKDPDEGDVLDVEFKFSKNSERWEIKNNTAYKKIESKEIDDATIITVIVSDGEHNDSQSVKMCVDELFDVELKPKVSFFYEYEGIEEKYTCKESDQPACTENHNISRITMEDPIVLELTGGNEVEGEWIIGSCRKIVLKSSCFIFPGWVPCNEKEDYEYDIENIKEKFEDCGLYENTFEKIRFKPSIHTGMHEVFSKVYVEPCIPHLDLSGEGIKTENLFLKSHSCCNISAQNSDHYGYVSGDSGKGEVFYSVCGKPDLGPYDLLSNDIWKKSVSKKCYGDRGNIYSPVETEVYLENPDMNCDDGYVENYGQNARRCKGCTPFGEITEESFCIDFDFSKKDENMDTFESSIFLENDAEDGYICNPNLICTSGPGRGNYLPDNIPAQGIMKCKAACNYGHCDYAVDCVCSSECGGGVDQSCEGKKPGEKIDKCDSEGTLPYYPDVCNEYCQVEDAYQNPTFKCDEVCDACDPECDGKKAYEMIDSCSAENTNYRDYCDSEGKVHDYFDPVNDAYICRYDENKGCTSSQECHGYPADHTTGTSGYYDSRYEDLCNEECEIVDSEICFSTFTNGVVSACHGKEPYDGFDFIGNSNPDAYCDKDCIIHSCNNFAYKESEKRCYVSTDPETEDVKCNVAGCAS